MLFAGNIAHADPFEGPPEPRIFGDWGLRTRLYEKGIDFQLGYVSELAYNAQGGIRNLTDYTDQIAVGIGMVNFLTTILAMFLIEKMGRRSLLIVGFTGAATTMLIIALAVINPTLVPSWVVILVLLLYIASFAISLGPLPHVMMSEIFPLRVRGPGMSMASISNWGFNFVVVFAFPLMLAGPGLAFTFTIFAVVCLGGILFTLARVPETTGHSLEAIEIHLMSGQPLVALKRVVAIRVAVVSK